MLFSTRARGPIWRSATAKLGSGEVDRRDGEVDLQLVDHLLIGTRWTRTSNIERSIVVRIQALAHRQVSLGSRSTASTRLPCSASATARFSVVVVFATPPFWFANAITRASVAPRVPVRSVHTGEGAVEAHQALLRRLPSPSIQVAAPVLFRGVRGLERDRAPLAPRRRPSSAAAPPSLRLGRGLHAHPRLRLAQERPQLVEECPGGASSRSSASIRSSRSST